MADAARSAGLRPASTAERRSNPQFADPLRSLTNRYNAFQQVLFNALFQTFEKQP